MIRSQRGTQLRFPFQCTCTCCHINDGAMSAILQQVWCQIWKTQSKQTQRPHWFSADKLFLLDGPPLILHFITLPSIRQKENSRLHVNIQYVECAAIYTCVNLWNWQKQPSHSAVDNVTMYATSLNSLRTISGQHSIHTSELWISYNYLFYTEPYIRVLV